MRQDPRHEHPAGPCREGLAPVACADPDMLVEDDGWDEKEVEPENEDNPISDLDSDLNED